jgi:hypothetical protein
VRCTYLIGIHLTGIYLIGVRLTDIYCEGVVGVVGPREKKGQRGGRGRATVEIIIKTNQSIINNTPCEAPAYARKADTAVNSVACVFVLKNDGSDGPAKYMSRRCLALLGGARRCSALRRLGVNRNQLQQATVTGVEATPLQYLIGVYLTGTRLTGVNLTVSI